MRWTRSVFRGTSDIADSLKALVSSYDVLDRVNEPLSAYTGLSFGPGIQTSIYVELTEQQSVTFWTVG